MTTKAIDLAAEALEHGWTVRITPGRDSGSNPFVTVEAASGFDRYVSVTWHTRGTGTYRLFNAVIDRRGSQAPLSRVRATLAAPASGSGASL